MHLFNKLFKTKGENNGIILLDKHKIGNLDDQEFLTIFAKTKVFYSTPLGDHISGKAQLFLLPKDKNSGYLPVFTSAENTIEFYKKMGRIGFIVMESTFIDFLKTTNDINQGETPIKMGVIIEPSLYDITIEASILDKVISFEK